MDDVLRVVPCCRFLRGCGERIPRRNRPLVRSAGVVSLRKTSWQGIYRNDVALTSFRSLHVGFGWVGGCLSQRTTRGSQALSNPVATKYSAQSVCPRRYPVSAHDGEAERELRAIACEYKWLFHDLCEDLGRESSGGPEFFLGHSSSHAPIVDEQLAAAPGAEPARPGPLMPPRGWKPPHKLKTIYTAQGTARNRNHLV
jgi:hypothetical protein